MIRTKLIIALSLLVLSSTVFCQESIKIAVMGFEAKNVAPATAAAASDAFRNELSASVKYTVVDKVKMEKLYKEQATLKIICPTPECAVESGKAFGVYQVAFGSLGRSGRNYLISVKVVNVATGGTIFSDSMPCDRESQFANISKTLISKITEQNGVAAVTEKSAPAPVSSAKAEVKAAEVLPKEETKPKTQAADKPAKESSPSFSSRTEILSEKEEASQTNLLKNKVGIGANWTGIQLRKELGNNIMVELKAQISADNILAAARGYSLFSKIGGSLPVQPYVGIEFGIPFSNVLTGGFEAGVFGGGELMVTKNIGVGIDVGPYYVSISSELGSYSDFGIIINLGVTYYF